MPRDSLILRKRLALVWPWAVGFAPAMILLVMVIRLRVPVPYADSWAFVEQYLKWADGGYGWADLFAKHGDHPSAVGKVIYFLVLHWLGGDVGLLPLLSWVLSLIVSICVCLLSRPLWTGRRLLGAVLIFCVNLTIFSAAQGGVWLWDFTYQNYIPGACLALGILLLNGGVLSPWRMAGATVLSLIAIFSFGAGFLVAALFTALIWRGLTGRQSSQKFLAACVWLAGSGAVAWIALRAFGPAGFTEEGPPVSLTVILDRPLMRLQFLLVLLGQMLGKGTVFEPLNLSAVLGGLLLLTFIGCSGAVFLRRADRPFVSAALPWILFSLYGLGNAVLISVGRMGKSANPFDAFHNVYALAERTMAERFIILTLFFVFGVLMLATLVVRNGGVNGMASQWGKAVAAPVLTALILAHIVNWESGEQTMKIESRLMKQERAMLGFGTILRLDGERLWNRQLKYHTFGMAKSLADRGRLRGVSFVADNRLTSFHRGSELPGKWAEFEMPIALIDGGWSLRGTCGVPNRDFSGLPDLVLVTAQAEGANEAIIAIAAPRLPETFLERQSQRRKYPEHYFGWAGSIESHLLPDGASTLRAYSFDSDRQTIRLIPGAHEVRK